MNVYVMAPAADNPLFEGLALTHSTDLLDTWPSNWRAEYKTWQPRSMKDAWPVPRVVGNVRKFNDYPCINLTKPAFSQRSVDLLGDLLEPNGELLPVRHELGTYFFYNCTRMVNCVDLTKSKVAKLADGLVTSTERLVFLEEHLVDVSIFKIRTQLLELFCTQHFVDRVEAARLQGFVFIPIWPLPEGATFFDEMYKAMKQSDRWKIKECPEVDIKSNAVVIRLYCEKKKASKQELADVSSVMRHLELSLYDAEQEAPEDYFGSIEGHDVVDYEIRVFISTPDCDRLVAYLMPKLRTLPWRGRFHVVKRRGEFVDSNAAEEYIRIA